MRFYLCIAVPMAAGLLASACQSSWGTPQDDPQSPYHVTLLGEGSEDSQSVALYTPEATTHRLRWQLAHRIVSAQLRKGWPRNKAGKAKRLRYFFMDAPKGGKSVAVFEYDPEAIGFRADLEADVKLAANIRRPTEKEYAEKQRAKGAARKPAKPSARSARASALNAIKKSCQRRMGEHGAALVKFCVDEDIKAYDALQRYPAKYRSVIARCKRTMLAMGGWNVVQFCADEDIKATKALEGY